MAVAAWVSRQGHGDTNPTTSCTITLGATAADNILILQVINGGANAAPTGPGGTYAGGAWTLVDSGGWTSGWGGVWWSRATANHSGQTITFSGVTDSISAQYSRVSGAVTSGTPYGATLASATVAAGADAALSSFITDEPDELVLFLVEMDDNLGPSAATMGGVAMNNLVSTSSMGGADSSVHVANLTQSQQGATGSFLLTVGAGTNQGKRATAIGIRTATPGTIPDLSAPLWIPDRR